MQLVGLLSFLLKEPTSRQLLALAERYRRLDLKKSLRSKTNSKSIGGGITKGQYAQEKHKTVSYLQKI